MSAKSTRQSVELRRERFWWLNNQILPNTKLPHSAFKVAYRISEGFNDQHSDGRCWESCKSIGDACGLSEQSVVRLVHLLHAEGDLRVEWGQQGSGHSNQYWMIVKPPPVEVSDEVKPPPVEVSDEVSAEIKPPSVEVSEKIKPPPVGKKPPPVEVNLSIEPSTPFGGALEDIPAAAFGDPGPNGPPQAAAGKKKKKDRRHGAGNGSATHPGNGPATPPGYDDVVPHWSEFTFLRETIWKRGDPKDHGFPQRRQDDIAAWTAALTRGSPEEIIAGAKKWAAAKADQPHMLTQLSIWLNADGWKMEPPRNKASSNGGGRGKSKSRRSHGDGESIRDELHKELAERMRRKGAMQ